MAKSRERVCLQDGLKLDFNRLAWSGFIRSGANNGIRGIRWTHSYWRSLFWSISADMRADGAGWLRVQIGGLDQLIGLTSRPRHFGGRQWYFVCPVTNRPASVLWKPPGATRFCSRQTWGRQVVYSSRFFDRDNRAHQGKARINSRLCKIAGLDADDWDLLPKPKWMRWTTYDRYAEQFDRYEGVLDDGCAALVARLTRR